eukprot:CAMPEP_0170647934 /NCGR_PEP_ID=MMETSP0224-20130122/44455_1 /TAXON_ID=285029 /ORGANISM="Togula jolla, Strain CCCM 725" /LENGTH=74 /DNA_ID=CAMNT_0010979405 /DNA_START=444 /DNA_END=665 /DNA_ORIENTATION=-
MALKPEANKARATGDQWPRRWTEEGQVIPLSGRRHYSNYPEGQSRNAAPKAQAAPAWSGRGLGLGPKGMEPHAI